MTINLVKVAALPQAGGCQSALPAEKNEESGRTRHARRTKETKERMELCGVQVMELTWPPIIFLDEEPAE